MYRLEELLTTNCAKWQDREYVFEKADGVYRGVTFGRFLENVRKLASYLLERGLAGKAALIYGDNSIRLMTADLAVLHYVGISVCVPKDWRVKDLVRTVGQIGASCILYGEEKAEVIAEVREQCPGVMCLCMTEFDRICEKAPQGKLPPVPGNGTGCCKIVFSSGTTSRPKAVMLSEKNLLAGIDSLRRRCPVGESDVDYLFLPLSHTYGGIYNFLYSLVFGFRLYLSSGADRIAEELLEVNPTIFCGVPLIYRRLYEQWGGNIADAFGTRIRYLFCGGAMMEEELRRAYKERGLDLLEAYALSETASTFSIQYPGDRETQSVGTVAEELEVKILDPDEGGVGEIAVRGDNVFLGYAGEPKRTEEAFTADGFFRTGDLGYLRADEEHGGSRLYLVGRRDRMLVGENGENLEPALLERLICGKNTNISRAQVYLEGGKPACKLSLKRPEQRDWERFFAEINAELGRHEKIQSFEIEESPGDEGWKR